MPKDSREARANPTGRRARTSPTNVAPDAASHTTALRGVRRAFLRRARRYLHELARRAPEAVLEDALAEPSAAGTIAHVMSAAVHQPGPLTAADQAIAAGVAEGTQFKRELLARAGGALSADQLGEILGVTRQAVGQARQANRYLGVPVPKAGFVYPRVQLTPDGVLPGLKAFLDAFQVPDPWTRLAVLLLPSGRLDGRTPLDALRAGDRDGAVAIAQAYGTHGA